MSNNRHSNNKRSLEFWATHVFPPLRIISILTFLPILGFRMEWGFASFVYYYVFFIVFFLTAVVEFYYYWRNRSELARHLLKHIMGLPIEFIAVFVFAISSLPFLDVEKIHKLEIEVTVMAVGISTIIELFHYIFLSREKIELDRLRIMAIIPLAVLMVYVGIFIHLFLLPDKSHI